MSVFSKNQTEVKILGSKTMKSKDQILSILADHLPQIKKQYHVKRLGVFGSVLRDQLTPESDIDILIEFTKPIGFVHFLRVENTLQELLDLKVDLATPGSLKKHIGAIIEKEVHYVS